LCNFLLCIFLGKSFFALFAQKLPHRKTAPNVDAHGLCAAFRCKGRLPKVAVIATARRRAFAECCRPFAALPTAHGLSGGGAFAACFLQEKKQRFRYSAPKQGTFAARSPCRRYPSKFALWRAFAARAGYRQGSPPKIKSRARSRAFRGAFAAPSLPVRRIVRGAFALPFAVPLPPSNNPSEFAPTAIFAAVWGVRPAAVRSPRAEGEF
jgi:hypothetical protein